MAAAAAALLVASALAASAVADERSVALSSGWTVTLSTRPDATATSAAFTDRTRARPARGELGRDADVALHARLLDLALVGEAGPETAIVADAYPSKASGLSECMAGRERFLRVLVAARGKVRETLRLKLESCVENVELLDGGLTWDAGDGTLTVGWLAAPGPGRRPQTQVYRVGGAGESVLVSRH